jgi:hypothetical protein
LEPEPPNGLAEWPTIGVDQLRRRGLIGERLRRTNLIWHVHENVDVQLFIVAVLGLNPLLGHRYIAVVREVSTHCVPSQTNRSMKILADEVPVARVPVDLNPVPKVRVNELVPEVRILRFHVAPTPAAVAVRVALAVGVYCVKLPRRTSPASLRAAVPARNGISDS